MNDKIIIVSLCLLAAFGGRLYAQSITFEVDDVVPASEPYGMLVDGNQIASKTHLPLEKIWDPKGTPKIVASSFAKDSLLFNFGEDALFKIIRNAWCQHRPLVLTPDAVWMVIAQGLSHHINSNPEELRGSLVAHEGRKELCVRTRTDLFSDQADWASLFSGFTSGIDKYTAPGFAGTLVADFSTTGSDERIASEITLMDAVKPYFEYTAVYISCGIPTVTLEGTPEDWQKLLDKTQVLSAYGLGWWQSELAPILKQFVSASKGCPDLAFWQNMVMTSRPDKVQGPTCSKGQPELTKFDGWFLKLFPFDNKGRTPSEVTLGHSVLPETVCVPMKYEVLAAEGAQALATYNLELIAGIVGVQQDPTTFALRPRIGWFVRMAE